MENFPLLEEYKHVRPLGEGAYGRVFLYRRKEELETSTSASRPGYVAIKAIPNSTHERQAMIRRRELYILKAVQIGGHKNIIVYFGSFEEDTLTAKNTVLVMEACHGDLRQLIKAKRVMRRKDLKRIGKQILGGLKYLHESKSLSEAQKRDFKILHR